MSSANGHRLFWRKCLSILSTSQLRVVSLAVQSSNRSEALTDPREMSLLTPRGSMTRSTFYNEDFGEVLDLSGHGTWANTDLCEIIQDLVDALSPLQTISKGHEERVAALEAVQKTAQEQADLENESDRKQLRDDAVAIASHRTLKRLLLLVCLPWKSLLHLPVRLRMLGRRRLGFQACPHV